MINFDSVRQSGDLLFESIRGSHLYGLAGPTSDVDTYGIWCCPVSWLLGSGRDYLPDLKSEKNDDSWVDIGKYIKLLEESNPDAIISLFTPADKILHFDPVLEPLWDIRDEILSKACFKSFSGYARDQLMKARGKNKKISINPEEVKVRKTPIDFCYVIRQDGGGTINLQDWLKEKGLKQEHCGLAHIQPGKGMYYLYYNWGEDKESTVENYMKVQYPKASSYSLGFYKKELEGEKEKAGDMITFRGILKAGEESEQLRLTSIPKEVQAAGPLCIFQYNQDAFSAHCKKYKEYWEWVEKRNQDRFVIDAEHGFNAKNLSHCYRLMIQGMEIAQGKGLILDRTGIDADILLDIKNHKLTYDEIMTLCESKQVEMEEAFEKSVLRDLPPIDKLENLLIEIRSKHYGL